MRVTLRRPSGWSPGNAAASDRTGSGGVLSSAFGAWRRDKVAVVASALVLGGVALLPLEAAATVELVYTIRPSYLLFLIAIVIGAPLVVRGWRAAPGALQAAAGLLLGAYLLATVLGDQSVGAGGRGGEHRDLVYLADMGLGLALVGLMIELMNRGLKLSRLLTAFLVGAVATGSFAIYQWPAQHFGWPFNDVNNALNTDGVSRGEVDSGEGLLGWARVRSTFREPHLLGSFMAIGLPMVGAWLALNATVPRRWAAVVMAMLIGGALLLTLSVPAWLVLGLSLAAAALALGISIGRPGVAAAAGATLAATLLIAFAGAAAPETFAALAGRSSTSLEVSGAERTDSWRAAITDWESSPLVGYGAGQSAVLLAGANDRPRFGPRRINPALLGTAHGIWAAALLDGGILALVGWIGLLGGTVVTLARAAIATRSAALAGLLGAALAAILAALETGDRLELTAWLIIGLALASAMSFRPDASGPTA